jgi:hypothetical protein
LQARQLKKKGTIVPRKKINLDNIVKAIDQVLEENPDRFMTDAWQSRMKPSDHYSFGKCYRSTETLIRLVSAFKEAGQSHLPDLKACKGVDGKDNDHYWAEDKNTGERHDITAAQFSHGQLKSDRGLLKRLYDAGKGRGLMQCSNDAKEMIALSCTKLGVRPPKSLKL